MYWITWAEAERIGLRDVVDAARRLAQHNWLVQYDGRGSFARQAHARDIRALRARARASGLTLRRVRGHGLGAVYCCYQAEP